MKHIHRFFVSEPLDAGVKVRLEPDDAFHAARVLRLREGEAVELADGSGPVFAASLSRIVDAGGEVEVEALAADQLKPAGSAPQGGVALAVVQALPSGRKLDLVVEKLSEIGAASLTPVFTERSVARSRKDRSEKPERWRRIARSAASQSRRTRVMDVAEPVDLSESLTSCEGRLLVLATEVEAEPLGQAVSGSPVGGALTLVVGPEAGFSDAEIDMMRSKGATFVNLGPLVLRTETAALVASVVVMHRLGRLG